MYADSDVVRFVTDNFVPVRAHVKEDAGEFQRLGEMFDVESTPTALVIDGTSQERHRVEGFVPKVEFTSQLEQGLARATEGR